MRHTASSKDKKTNTSRIRIIGGQWRSRKLLVPAVDGLRPTGERIRETLFNWLNNTVHDSRCLDLFAGTGALGLEALSRGAQYCQFVEHHPEAAKLLRENITKLTSEQRCADVSLMDANRYLTKTEPGQPFDLVFVDPPFALNLWQEAFDQLLSRGWVHGNTLIYVEQPRDSAIAPQGGRRIKHKIAGQVSFSLYSIDGDLPT